MAGEAPAPDARPADAPSGEDKPGAPAAAEAAAPAEGGMAAEEKTRVEPAGDAARGEQVPAQEEAAAVLPEKGPVEEAPVQPNPDK